MKLAILLQCHKNPEQVNLFLEMMKDPDITCFIHVDRKTDISDEIKTGENVLLLPDSLRVSVCWAQYSQVQATLNLLRFAKKYRKFDYYWVCSGQDFPIKPPQEIMKWFEDHSGSDFLELFESKNYSPKGQGKENKYDKRTAIYFPAWMLGDTGYKRIFKRLWVEVTGGYHRTFPIFRRKKTIGMEFYHGSSWICLSGRSLEWMDDYLYAHPEYVRYFQNCNCPDETFFQTLLMHSPYRNYRENYLHYVDWSEGGNRPKTLTLQDMEKLRSSEFLMARKLDLDTDRELFEKISEEILHRKMEHAGDWRQLALSEIKEKEVELLKRFAEFCDAHDLCYVLGGGTLLGAIRHQGFIPWDDDIDVMMPRPDYLRFIQLQENERSLPFVTITNDTTSYPFMKVIDPEVKIDMTYVDSIGSDHLWMDIFPIDGLPGDEKQNRRVFFTSLFLRRLLFIANAKLGKGTTKFRKVVKIPMHILLGLVGRFRLAHMIDRYCQRRSFEDSAWVGGLAWGYGPQEKMPKKEWLQREKVIFEGEEFWAPGCWDLYLSRLYGDYRKLPPLSEQNPHNMSAWTRLMPDGSDA